MKKIFEDEDDDQVPETTSTDDTLDVLTNTLFDDDSEFVSDQDFDDARERLEAYKGTVTTDDSTDMGTTTQDENALVRISKGLIGLTKKDDGKTKTTESEIISEQSVAKLIKLFEK